MDVGFFLGEVAREGRSISGKRAVMNVLKVSSQSKPKSVAGALAAVLRESGTAEIQAVGAGAVNQAVKAIAIARGFVVGDGMDIVAIPGFQPITIDGEERTAIRFIIESRAEAR